MIEVYTNFARSTLASGISAGATSLTVASGDGALFPAMSGRDYFTVFLIEGSTKEEITVTARSSDTFTHSATVNAFTTAAKVVHGWSKTRAARLPTGDGTGSKLTYTTNLSFHYKASNATLTGSRVTALNDSAGSGVNLAQATAANQPFYLPNRINGHPTLLFDGGRALTAASSPMNATNNFTVFCVVIPYLFNDTNDRRIWSNGTGNAGNGYSLASNTTTIKVVVENVASANLNALFFVGAPQIIMLQRSSGTSSMYRNNNLLSTTFANTPSTPTAFTIGGTSSSALFEIADVLGFNAVLGSTDRGTVFADLGAAYNIPVE